MAKPQITTPTGPLAADKLNVKLVLPERSDKR
jgi:hypothetical protein